ncbi:MAG: TolC family protein, partial [Gammaproteobacteria bacterium]|nr:TolC family protein [Gammaproteobacteria bacterium]
MPGSSQAEWSLAAGWSALGSRELDELLARAQAANLDLRSAAERLLQAEIRADLAGAALSPTADLSLNTALDGTWGQSATARRSGLSLSASYEVDLWGRLRAQRDAALAALRVSQFDQRIVQLGVEAAVVTLYVQMLSLHERLQTAQLNLDNARQVMTLVEARVRHGQAAPLERAQQRATLARQEAALPPLRQQLASTQAQLDLLLGEPAASVPIRARALDTLQVPVLNADIPVERLWQRPDIAQAEARLHGARADVRAARAAL